MKAIKTNAFITGFSTKVDGSLSGRFSTPELNSAEKTVLMDLQGLNVELTITPLDNPVNGTVEVENKIEGKKPSQRLRSVLFILWKQKHKEKYPDFDVFYHMKMNQWIESLKEQIGNL